METRDDVRQRRIERIKQLQETSQHPLFQAGELEDVNNEPLSESARWDDPEYVWNRKWKQEYVERKNDYNEDGGRPYLPRASTIRTKLLLSCALFAIIWCLFQWNHPMANKAKSYVAAALNEPFDFQKVALWYERQWGGNPSLLPAWLPGNQQEAQKVTAFNKHYFPPVKGKVIAPYEPSRLGVTLETNADANVAAFDTGLVIYKGSKEDTGQTIIIRHTNGLQSVYGWIEQAKVEPNDWVKGGETIGVVSKNASKQAGYLYFALSKENRFLNPMDVVAFD
jgi:stage IV sporulation protein FA